jgi:hypothetical protein
MTDKINPMLTGIDEDQRKRLAAGLMAAAPQNILGLEVNEPNSGVMQNYIIAPERQPLNYKPPSNFDHILNYLERNTEFPTKQGSFIGNNSATVGPSSYGLYLRGRMNPMMKPNYKP